MNKTYLKGIPALLAILYMIIFPMITVSMYGWNIANILAIASGVFVFYQIIKLAQWIAKSGLLNLLNLGGQFK